MCTPKIWILREKISDLKKSDLKRKKQRIDRHIQNHVENGRDLAREPCKESRRSQVRTTDYAR